MVGGPPSQTISLDLINEAPIVICQTELWDTEQVLSWVAWAALVVSDLLFVYQAVFLSFCLDTFIHCIQTAVLGVRLKLTSRV